MVKITLLGISSLIVPKSETFYYKIDCHQNHNTDSTFQPIQTSTTHPPNTKNQ